MECITAKRMAGVVSNNDRGAAYSCDDAGREPIKKSDVMIQKQSRISTIILAIGVIAALFLLVSQGPDLVYWKKKLGLFSTTSQTVDRPKTIISITESTEVAADAEKQAVPAAVEGALALNAQGVALIARKRTWEGMHYLEQAIQLEPSQIVPIINMAVVLSEMGFDRPAERYLGMAQALNPNHPWLKKNFPGISPDRENDQVNMGSPLVRRQVDVGGLPDANDGIRLWDDGTLMLWGIDGSEVY